MGYINDISMYNNNYMFFDLKQNETGWFFIMKRRVFSNDGKKYMSSIHLLLSLTCKLNNVIMHQPIIHVLVTEVFSRK